MGTPLTRHGKIRTGFPFDTKVKEEGQVKVVVEEEEEEQEEEEEEKEEEE
jgi:hypothetical protein